MNMINYTIIIPHYNSYELLKKCVKSIPSREDIQIVVVDDNTLESPPTTFFWQDFGPYVDKILLKENRTAGGARNEGIKILRVNGLFLLMQTIISNRMHFLHLTNS